MAGPIFINYRRGENLRDAQHLATLLTRRFGDKGVFLDVRGLDGGEQWLPAIEKQVSASDAMVALIGKNWLDLKDEDGKRRLDNTHDFVRFEIAQALQRNIPVLPVLLDGAPMPKINQLPHDMMALTLFQGMPLRIESVVQDAETISRRLKVMLDQRRRRGVPGWIAAAAAAVILAAGAAAGAYIANLLASTSSSLQAQITAANEEAAKAREETEKLRPVAQDRDHAWNAVFDANQKIRSLQGAADSLTDELSKAKAEVERLRPAVQERDQARSALAIANQKIADLQKAREPVNIELAKPIPERWRSPSSERDQPGGRLGDVFAGRSAEPRSGSNRFLTEFFEPASAARKLLGMTLSSITPELRDRYRIRSIIDGVVVLEVDPNSSAAQKGIGAGDVIVTVSFESVSSPAHVETALAKLGQDNAKTATLLFSDTTGNQRFVALPLDLRAGGTAR